MVRRSSPLVRLETARRLLAEVRSVDDAKAIHDVAEAARIYARQARLGLEAQNDAAEIKLRAERKLGELLAAIRAKHPGGNANLSQPATGWNRTGQAAGPWHFQKPIVTLAGDRRRARAQSSIGTSPMSASRAAATARRS